MAIIGIVAISRNFAIGKDGKLPWHYSADLKHFKKTTIGSAVVMGRTTWETLVKSLPDRLNITLSRTAATRSASSVVHLTSKEETLELAKYLACDTFIIGGGKTFAEFADVIEKWIVTEIPIDVPEADTFMPADFLEGFELCDTTDLADSLVVKVFVRR